MTRTSKPLSGRQVARMVTHGSDRGVRRPPAHQYSLNRDHIAAPVAEALVSLREELHSSLRTA